MNSIESDFLKVMTAIDNKKRRQYILPDERQKLAATELAGRMERFIEWLQFDDYLFIDTEIKGKWMKVDKNDSEYYTLSDLYSYWLEIDKK